MGWGERGAVREAVEGENHGTGRGGWGWIKWRERWKGRGEKRGSWEGIWEIIVWDQRCVRNRKDGGVKDFTGWGHEKGKGGRWKDRKCFLRDVALRMLKDNSGLLQFILIAVLPIILTMLTSSRKVTWGKKNQTIIQVLNKSPAR